MADNQRIAWYEDADDDENPTWEAPSPWHDGGDPFMFRIRMRLRSGCIEYYDASDDECGMSGEWWPTLETAKAAYEEARKTILREIDNVP